MAKGKTASVTVVQNNSKATAVTNTVELIVVDGALVPDKNDIEHGVDTRNLKN